MKKNSNFSPTLEANCRGKRDAAVHLLKLHWLPRRTPQRTDRTAVAMAGYYEKMPSDDDGALQPIIAKDGREPAAGRTWQQRVQIIAACSTYAVVGPTLIVVNNHILKHLSFHYPMLVATAGLLTTSAVCATCVQLVPRLTRAAVKASPPPTNSSSAAAQPPQPPPSPLLEFDEEEPDTPVGGVHDAPRSAAQVTFRFWLHNMVPIGAAQGLTFACSNAAYMYLTITFNQMLAALTPSVTLLLLYLLGVETPTRRTSAAVVLISAGCFISSYGEGHFDLVGVGFRSMGIVSEAVRLVLTQKLLKSFHLSVLESQYYLAPVGAFFLLLAALPSELPHALRTGALVVVADHPLEFLASASLGVVASMMTFVVIKLTNSVTLKVLNTARNAAFVLFSVTFLQEPTTALQLSGYVVSLASFGAYTFYKSSGR